MRSLKYILLLAAVTGLAGSKYITMKPEDLNGRWIPVKQEFGGKELPKSVFESQELIINDSTYIFTAESIDKGILKFTENKIDIYGKEGVNIGKHFTAIYKYENEELTICYNLAGNGYPESFDIKNKPMHFLSVFKRK